MKRKWRSILIFLLVFVLSLVIFRVSILRGLGNYLMVEDYFDYVEYALVLSGGAYDRANWAADLFHEGKVSKFICTGENQSGDLKSFGIDTLESDLSELQLLKNKVPQESILKIKKGTSTQEESDVVLSYCLNHDIKELVIVSSKFHTRRVKQVFKKKFANEGIEVYITGASSSVYNEEEWWKNEYGLIALNNEYLKQIYYLFKY